MTELAQARPRAARSGPRAASGRSCAPAEPAPLRAPRDRRPSAARPTRRPRRRRARSVRCRRGTPRPERDTRRRAPRRTRAPPRRGGASPRRRPRRRAPPRPTRTCSASAPCAASGSISSGSNRRPISRPRPSRSSPHAASTIASSPRSPRLRRRVSMFPRSGSIESVGSSASSCARRRTDAVPIRIPGRSAAAPHSASRGSSRGRYAPDREPRRVRRGHVLRGVDGDVDPPGEQRLLELLDEDAALTDLAERASSGRGRRPS